MNKSLLLISILLANSLSYGEGFPSFAKKSLKPVEICKPVKRIDVDDKTNLDTSPCQFKPPAPDQAASAPPIQEKKLQLP